MRLTFLKAASRAAWLWIALAVAGVLWAAVPGPASAGFCPAKSCKRTLTNSSFIGSRTIGSGTFGAVSLKLPPNAATVDARLSSVGDRVHSAFESNSTFGADGLQI